MKTDTIFYHLFQNFPTIFFELIGQESRTAADYEFTSVELKQLAFRLDGLFLPQSDAPDDPIYFVEVQFQKDSALYPRLFTEAFVYLYQHNPPQDWQAVVIYPRPEVDPGVPHHYREFFDSGRVIRVYLDELAWEQPSSLGLGIVRLITEKTAASGERARALIAQAREERLDPVTRPLWRLGQFVDITASIARENWPNLTYYKFPRKSRQEIEAMLELSDLKETRVYREAWQEGRQEGHQEGRQEGQQEGIREGLLAGIELGLELKFGAEGLHLLPEIYKIRDVAVLRALHEGLKVATTLAEWQRIYAAPPASFAGALEV